MYRMMRSAFLSCRARENARQADCGSTLAPVYGGFGTTLARDGITVTVAEGNTEYYYLTFVTRNEFETEYNGSVAAFANATVELLNQDIEDWNL